MSSIRGRLLVLLLIGLTSVLVAGGAAIYGFARTSLVAQFDENLEARGQALLSLVSWEPPALKFDGDDADLLAGEAHFELRTETGELLKRSHRLGTRALPRRSVAEGTLVFGDVDLPESGPARVVWIGFRPRAEEDDDDDDLDDEERLAALGPVAPEALVMAAAIDRGPLDRTLATLVTVLLAVCGVGALMVGVIVAGGVRWGLRPLERLSRRLGTVSADSLSARFPADVPRELVPIHRELNGMLDRVEATLDRERTFVDSAAHELRTPLAELRTTIDVATRWPDLERATAALVEARAIGRDIERLVETLLLISRADAGTLDGAAADVPIAQVVAGCLERSARPLIDRRVQVAVGLDGEIVHAARGPLEIIVGNLVGNAVEHTPPGGRIEIGVATAGDGWALFIENGPVELSAADVDRLFEPFWRLDRARSDRRHLGLGLAVVERTAAAIGLRVEADLAGDRLRMSLWVPADEA